MSAVEDSNKYVVNIYWIYIHDGSLFPSPSLLLYQYIVFQGTADILKLKITLIKFHVVI